MPGRGWIGRFQAGQGAPGWSRPGPADRLGARPRAYEGGVGERWKNDRLKLDEKKSMTDLTLAFHVISRTLSGQGLYREACSP